MTINYIVKVTANYSGGETDEAEVLVRFVPPTIIPITLSDIITVHIPDEDVALGTRLFPGYTPPLQLTFFDDNYFNDIPRTTLEYILSVAATIQRDFVNDNTYLFEDKFEEFMFRDPVFGGAYSLWFTDPVAFGVGDIFMQETIDYSSLFHEMGHNFTLNTPGTFYFGGRIDGNANAIYSESMAQIFQHATGYEIVNNYDDYGLSMDLMMDIKQQVIRTIKFVRDEYDLYILNNKPFTSWNDPSTEVDETMLTFMTIAYKFCEHAEISGEGYLLPLQRMMSLLQGFCQEWMNSYDQLNNNATADEFRSTLMVKALSEAFQTDLREEFRDLNFPVSDQIYNALPVELVSFTGTAVLPSSIRLNWQTATEVNNYGFEVERKSSDNWQKIGFVQGNGNSNSLKEYSYLDKYPIGVSKFQYRLKQMDNDGQYEYSNVIEVDIRLLDKFTLEQNYPNPFNPSTKISWQSPVSSWQTLKVYDALGSVVATLVDEYKNAGSYEVEFNASYLASGIYYYQLRCGHFISTKKLIHIK